MNEIRDARYRYWTKRFENRVECFFDKLSESKMQSGSRNCFVDGGREICGFCFRSYYKINKNFYYKYLKKCGQGARSNGLQNSRSFSKATENTISWLKNYAYYHADRMPDSEDLMLPYKTRKTEVYRSYCDDMIENLKPTVCRSTFFDTWTREFKRLKIKQVLLIL